MAGDGGFYVLPSYYAALSLLPVKDRGEVWAAMMDYAFAGVAPELPARLMPYWLLIQPSIDAAAKRKQRRANVQPTDDQRISMPGTTGEYLSWSDNVVTTMAGQCTHNVTPSVEQCTYNVTTMDEQCTHNVTPTDEQCRDIGRFPRARENHVMERERERDEGQGNETRDEGTRVPTASPMPTFSQESNALFERVWAAYPRKVGRYQAQHAWSDILVDEALTNRIIASIAEHKAQPDWQKDNGRFIPTLANFLRDKRWEDQFDTQVNVTGRTLSPQERAAIRELMEG